MAGIESVNPESIKAQKSPQAAATAKDFNAFLGAVQAMGPAGATAAQQYGTVNSSTVLSAAFSGVSSLNAQSAMANGYPSMAYGGYGGGAYGSPYLGKDASLGTGLPYAPGDPGSLGMPGAGQPVIPGTQGFSQADLINTMNQNNLQLLELQATMQSNMQSWNTKSNILSADHRARMAMIEKFTAR